ASWFIVPSRLSGRTQAARRAAARADLEALDVALDAFAQDTGRYPTAAEGLGALFSQPAGAAGWHGPYVRRPAPLDPWGFPYVYLPAPPPAASRVVSVGRDGRQGTPDDVAARPAGLVRPTPRQPVNQG